MSKLNGICLVCGSVQVGQQSDCADPDCPTHIPRLEARVAELEKLLRELRPGHRSCDDTWYCCAKHPEYSGPEDRSECTCGYDRIQQALDAGGRGMSEPDTRDRSNGGWGG